MPLTLESLEREPTFQQLLQAAESTDRTKRSQLIGKICKPSHLHLLSQQAENIDDQQTKESVEVLLRRARARLNATLKIGQPNG